MSRYDDPEDMGFNRWYSGHIGDTGVAVFLCDDFAMDTFTVGSIPAAVEKICRSIRDAKCRSLSGCQKVLKANNWHNC